MDKFLTVFAVFDEQTQQKLTCYQTEIFKLGALGTQTMGIPFHLTLGSFPVNMEKELVERIASVSENHFKFNVALSQIGHFGNKVLFAEPEESSALLELHSIFDGNYPYGHPYHAHATLFQGDETDVIKAKNLMNEIFTPIDATIVSIQMGEFFPTRMIVRKDLR